MNKVHQAIVFSSLLLISAPVFADSGSAGVGWQPGFNHEDLDSQVKVATVFDDGGGQALFVGGVFTTAGSATVNSIARWDGAGWTALEGPSAVGVDGVNEGDYLHVEALAAFDDGGGPALYVGGTFLTAGGISVNNIAKWDGEQWSALAGSSGIGIDGTVSALAVYDDGGGEALYAAGNFAVAGGISANNIAKWDGSQWSALGGASATGLNNGVGALVVFDGSLFAGGGFTQADGVGVNRIAKWDGASWSALSGPSGTGVGGGVVALAVYDDGKGAALFAGGAFPTAGGVTVNGVAKWDGASWSALSGPMGTGVGGEYPWVNSLAVYDEGSGPALFAGGQFTTAGGGAVNQIARWDGTSWSALDGPSGTGMGGVAFPGVECLAVFDPGTGDALFAGGFFFSAGGVGVNHLAQWDGASWSVLSQPSGAGMSYFVAALEAYDDGAGAMLYAGGEFTRAGVTAAGRIAKWNGSRWSALAGPSGEGMNNVVWALAVYDDGGGQALYAGGDFTTAAGIAVDRVAKWDGADWSIPGGPSAGGMDGTIHAFEVFDDGTGTVLYAGGSFVTAGGVTVNYVAGWDGSGWSALSGSSGFGTNHSVSALAVYDDGTGSALYVGGGFTEAGGQPANFIAKWDGAEWSALGVLLDDDPFGYVHALAVYDDGSGPALFAGGSFTTADGITVDNIAKWDGTQWSALEGTLGFGTNGSVGTLAVYDDGNGEALYAGGKFETAGGVTVNRIARWDGERWSSLSGPSGVGLDGDSHTYDRAVYTLDVFNDGTGNALFAGGSFATAGGIPSSRIAKWTRDPQIFADGFETEDTSMWSVTQP